MPDIKHFDPDTAVAQVVPLLWRGGWSRTGIQDVVTATGISRSSLYSTFGSKDQLYLHALRRYLAEYAGPAFRLLETDGHGLTAIAAFFGRLITARCSGEHARWGCLATNLHVSDEATTPGAKEILAGHHRRLVAAMRSALDAARHAGQLRGDVEVATSAEHLALLAHGVNVRSRAGEDETTLRSAVAAALHALRRGSADADIWPGENPPAESD